MTQSRINLGNGEPSSDLLPLDILQKATSAFFEGADPSDINYSSDDSDQRFTAAVANMLTQEYGSQVNPQQLNVTGGNSQGIDIACSVLTKPGDTVFVEDPTYLYAFQIFNDHHLNVVPLPMDNDGLMIESVEEALKTHSPSMIYTVPSYHNPTGTTMSEARRRRLAALSKEHGFTILADEVYQLLHYYEKPPPAFGAMIEDGAIVSLGSFSKILAPGLRLGWLQANDPLMARILEHGVLYSGGSVNHFGSHIARHVIETGLQLAHLERIRPIYRRRLEAMDTALCDHFGNQATWVTPEGGYFLWLGLPEEYDAAQLHAKASDYGVGFHTGAECSSQGHFKTYMRLSFSAFKEDDLQEGIARLAKLVNES